MHFVIYFEVFSKAFLESSLGLFEYQYNILYAIFNLLTAKYTVNFAFFIFLYGAYYVCALVCTGHFIVSQAVQWILVNGVMSSNEVLAKEDTSASREESASDLREAEASELSDIAECFHGFISKRAAETRLRDSGIDGALLLRSDFSMKYCICWLPTCEKAVIHFT